MKLKLIIKIKLIFLLKIIFNHLLIEAANLSNKKRRLHLSDSDYGINLIETKNINVIDAVLKELNGDETNFKNKKLSEHKLPKTQKKRTTTTKRAKTTSTKTRPKQESVTLDSENLIYLGIFNRQSTQVTTTFKTTLSTKTTIKPNRRQLISKNVTTSIASSTSKPSESQGFLDRLKKVFSNE